MNDNSFNCYIMLVHGADDHVVCLKYWIAAMVQINFEKKVKVKLNKLGLGYASVSISILSIKKII